MSDELERLRAKLDVLRECRHWVYTKDAISDTQDKISKLEAEAADPWRENYKAIEKWRKMDDGGLAWEPQRKAIALVDHLTAENADLKQKYDLANDTIKTAAERLNDTKGELTAAKIMIADRDDKIATLTVRVAELKREVKIDDDIDILTKEDRKALELICIESIIESAHKPDPDDPILDPARVLATACELLHQLGGHWQAADARGVWKQSHLTFSAKPYRLKGGDE